MFVVKSLDERALSTLSTVNSTNEGGKGTCCVGLLNWTGVTPARSSGDEKASFSEWTVFADLRLFSPYTPSSFGIHLSFSSANPIEVMSQPHPLETPEILWEVSKYVSGRTLLACVRVSMAWYQTFLPQIWKDIELTKNKAHPSGAIHGYMYNRLVKILRIRGALKREHSSLSLPNLASLTIENANWDENLFRLVGNHPTLIHLDQRGIIGTHSTRFLGILAGLHRLKDLKLMGLEVNENNVDTFWQLCARLERLDVSFQQISTQDRQPSIEFPSMRELQVKAFPVNSAPWILDFMQRCPGLGSFESMSNRLRIAPLVSAGTWPHLQSIALWVASKDDEDVANIVAGMQRIIAFEVLLSFFTPRVMDLLRPHFIHLQTLGIDAIQGFTSAMAQEIMSSCPSLTKFKGCKIRAVDIVGGQPWVCLKLKILQLGIYADVLPINQVQPSVFDQLSRLTQLQELLVYCGEREEILLDLRLEYGLGRLSTLRSLRLLDFGVSQRQMMRQPEIEWILEHWKSLERIHGKLNALNPALDKVLKMKLTHHGIAVSL